MKRDAIGFGAPFGVPPHALDAAHLGRVTSVDDPESLARVKVELYNMDTSRDVSLWARVAAAFAGADRGAFFLPQPGDEVLVVFVNGDPRAPVVVGGLWNGTDRPPESVSGGRVDRWTITGKAGTKIAIVEETDATAKIQCTTPAGVSVCMTDEGGGKVEIVCAGNTITVDSGGVSVRAAATVSVQASRVNVSAATVNVDAAVSSFSGVVRCDVMQATTVIASTYTPGAGNIW
jgi:uncharacterized protein involved in type VI secretion and phage assembly